MAGLDELAYLNAIENIEEAEVLAMHGPRRIYDPQDPFGLSDEKFIQIYRLTKDSMNEVIDMITPFMTAPSRISALSIERKILTTIRFYGSGSYQSDIGHHLNHAICQASVSRCIEEVTNALNNEYILNRIVKLPQTPQELNKLRNRFFQEYGIPGVIGCVDCTHVAIFPPHINDPNNPEVIYVNRKGYHSINTQLICDTDLRILNVCARFPGSSNDMFIWNNSHALQYITNLHRNGYNSCYFIGDSGYYLRPWLMSPIQNAPAGSPEERYNTAFKSCRSMIERCNGVLKMRFRCLLKYRALHYHPEKSAKIINACTVLHNLCIENNNPPPQTDPEDNLNNINFGIYHDELVNYDVPQIFAGNRPRRNPDLEAGETLQRNIVRNYFTL